MYVYIYIYIYICVYIYIYIYIYIYMTPLRSTSPFSDTPKLPTNIVDFGGFDSSTILNSRGEIPRPIGNFPESLSQAMLVGTMLVGGLGGRAATMSQCSVPWRTPAVRGVG